MLTSTCGYLVLRKLFKTNFFFPVLIYSCPCKHVQFMMFNQVCVSHEHWSQSHKTLYLLSIMNFMKLRRGYHCVYKLQWRTFQPSWKVRKFIMWTLIFLCIVLATQGMLFILIQFAPEWLYCVAMFSWQHGCRWF